MASCPFDDLFSGVVSVHSMVTELHKLKPQVRQTWLCCYWNSPDQTQNRTLESDQFVLQGDGEEEAEEDGNMLKTDQSSTARAESGRKEPMRADLAERDDNGPLHRVIILGSAEVEPNQSLPFLLDWDIFRLERALSFGNYQQPQVQSSEWQFVPILEVLTLISIQLFWNWSKSSIHKESPL